MNYSDKTEGDQSAVNILILRSTPEYLLIEQYNNWVLLNISLVWIISDYDIGLPFVSTQISHLSLSLSISAQQLS